MPDLTADLTTVYAGLHAILAPYAARLAVVRDDGQELYVETRYIQKNRKPLFFGAVQVKKSYVAFHLMPVYTRPALLDAISPALRARMQGKSCFNFKATEPALFQELASLTEAGFASYEEQGFV
jgi:hypothetical protein